MPAETVTIPARLLRDLVWAAESLTNIEAEDGDRTMINEARRALEQQAPRMTRAMLEVDVMIEQSDGEA